MRRIDARAGAPLCAALTLLRRLRGADPVGRDEAPRNVLIVKLAEQGATVVAVPAIRRLQDAVGPSQVWIAVFAENRPILDELDVVPSDRILTIRTGSPVAFARDLLRVVRRARRAGIDTTVDLEGFSRSSALLAVATGARRRAGLYSFAGEGSYRGDLMTHRVAANPLLHAGDQFLALAEAALIDPGELPALPIRRAPAAPPPAVGSSDADRRRVATLVCELLGTREVPPLVLLNPNAGDLLPLRRWPSERYVELARRLLEDDARRAVLFTGGPDEAAATRELAAAVGSSRCASCAGRTSLHDLLVLYGMADLLVTNDSGPAHYSSLTTIRSLVLFGPEAPDVFAPRTPRSVPLWSGLACSPCVSVLNGRSSACTDNRCMQEISVEEVVSRAVELLAPSRCPEVADGPTTP